MGSRVEFAVSATPIFSHSAGEGEAVDVIAADVGKTVGGSGNVTVTWGSTGGYASGSPTYVSTGSNIVMTSGKFIWIKHTGYQYSDGSTLGAATTETLTIAVGAVTVAILGAGQAITLPYSSATSNTFVLTASSGTIAVEYFWSA